MTTPQNQQAKIAVIGAGWWGQGWHIPCLSRNPSAELVAICDQSEHPQSDMDNALVSLTELGHRYNCKIYYSLETMLQDIGSQLDGVIVSTPHATHYHIGKTLYEYAAAQKPHRKNAPLHILMEKPMTTDMVHALALYQLVQSDSNNRDSSSSSSSSPRCCSFWINHSANFRPQARQARQALVEQQTIGRIRHVMCSMASPVQWVFQNPDNLAWTKPSGTMLGNGFAWGQSCHLLGWIYFVLGDLLEPLSVFCAMNHEPMTGADMSHSATVLCRDDIVMNVSGTAWLPGSQYAQRQVGKEIRIQIYGTNGALFYEGQDSDPTSGRLEIRRHDGSVQVLCDSFLFESAKNTGYGAESVVDFVQLCSTNHHHHSNPNKTTATMMHPTPENCANVMVGLKTVQTLEAMYRSHAERALVDVRKN